MLQSRLFYKTLKTTPKDAQTRSHQLLMRGGFIEQISAGRYAFLPLGFLVWEKILNVIDREMRKIGSQRVLTPTLHPIEIWKKTNRDKAFGEEMILIEDHHGSTFALGATAEGLMTEMVKGKQLSYKDLPVVIHQFVQKFRDEKRPRGGLLRVREFMMKDAYSFHASEEDLLEWYQRFFDSYQRIARAFDLSVIPVEADSGAIGGEYNHEFMVIADSGEDKIFICAACGYAANSEKAESAFKEHPQDKEMKERKDVLGEGIVGVEALAEFLNIPVHVTTKTLIYETSEGEIVAAMVRGDYDINEVKLRRYLKTADVRLAPEDVVKEVTGADIGYAGPIGLPEHVRVVADLTCKGRVNFEAGANRTNYHSLNVNFERDFPLPEFADIRQVKPGDGCPRCKDGVLEEKRAIEWGHVFHQGQFYARPHEATYVDEKGKSLVLWQGAYGIGIGRTMATIVETHHDEKGIIWPPSVTPFHVHLINLKKDDSEAREVYERIQQEGFSVLFDDRDKNAGEKFAEADLLGITVRLVVSEKTKGSIEWKDRREQDRLLLEFNEVVEKLKKTYPRS